MTHAQKRPASNSAQKRRMAGPPVADESLYNAATAASRSPIVTSLVILA